MGFAPTRVLIVTSRLDVGGTEGHLVRVLPALQRRGINLTLYVMERGGPLEAELLANGIKIEGPHRMRPLHWPRASLKLARFLRRERPTVVHFFLPRPYIYGSIAAELAGHRLRLMSRRSLSHYRSRYPLLGSIERTLHRRTSGLIANSRAVFDQLEGEVGDRRKLTLIHNGVHLPAQQSASSRVPTRRRLGIADDALVMIVVANLIPYKGHADLIEALARAKDNLPGPWTVLTVGRDDGNGAELKRKALALKLADNFL